MRAWNDAAAHCAGHALAPMTAHERELPSVEGEITVSSLTWGSHTVRVEVGVEMRGQRHGGV
jgi:hypothetical protein